MISAAQLEPQLNISDVIHWGIEPSSFHMNRFIVKYCWNLGWLIYEATDLSNWFHVSFSDTAEVSAQSLSG